MTKISADRKADVWSDAEESDAPSRCLWVKITQLLGEVSCCLLPIHDGNHCSVEWMEWA
jgi:hypothetical protein